MGADLFTAYDLECKRLKRREQERGWYAANPEKVCARKRSAYAKDREKNLARGKRYRAENAEKTKDSQKKWIEANREKRAQVIRDYINNREKIDPQFKLVRTMRARLRKAVKRNFRSGGALDHLGCTIAELKNYLQSLWLPGMTWDNWAFRGWHIDHIRPLSSFDLTDPVQLATACHYTNLQPLWWRDNLQKGNTNAS